MVSELPGNERAGIEAADRGADEAEVVALLEGDLADLYEHAPCGYLSALPDGTIVKVNATFCQWTGYRRDELVGRRRFQELLTAGGRIYHETHYAPLLRMQGFVREIAVDIVRADGGRLPALVNSVLRSDASGEPLLVRTTIFDATERREYERELLRARERAQRSEAHARELARTLQASLIPPAPPQVPGLDLATVYRPAGQGDEVGGDFYDVFETAAGQWAFVIGDVCGKGPRAAAVTALARYSVRAAAIRLQRPSLVLGTLNEALLRSELDRFCTAAFARLRRGAHGGVSLVLSCGGHPLPLRASAAGRVEPVGRPGTLLGVVDEPDLTDVTVELAPGESLVFYTDGITEAGDAGRMFGEKRLCAVVAAHHEAPAQVAATAIVDAALAYQGGHARDDIAVMVLRVPPEA